MHGQGQPPPATRATAPTGGARPIKLQTSRPCPLPPPSRSGAGQATEPAAIDMTLATATSAFESRFDRFLYAAVREDPDGTPLTVLSVLARLDIDPWKEAARLAQLPGEAAARALAVLISALPKGSATPSDSETIAARLITLLPHRPERETAVHRAPSDAPRVIQIPNRATIVARAVLCLVVFALLLVSQWLAVRHLAILPAKGPLAAPATAVPAPAAPPDAALPIFKTLVSGAPHAAVK
jgi:hypothetical protein